MSGLRIDHKQGDTIVWDCHYTDDIGGTVDITTYDLKCQARLKNNMSTILFTVSSLDNTIDKYAPTNGNFKITQSTTDFPIGVYQVDIQYTFSGIVKSTETFELNIYEDVTQ